MQTQIMLDRLEELRQKVKHSKPMVYTLIFFHELLGFEGDSGYSSELLPM